MLFGRAEERARIERLLNDARRGRGGTLVLRGEPGVGKTSLVRYATDLAEAMTVVGATGVEAEAELDFSGLLEVCRPLLGGIGALPEHQAEALRGALGLTPGRPRDRFAVGAATLGLIAVAAESRPVLVVVDDGQWVDAASVDALRFAARRLENDPVAFLVAVRVGRSPFDGAGFDELVVEGLDVQATGQLLNHAADSPVADDVAARLHRATRGNPLSLVELPRLLTAEQLAGQIEVEEPLPVGAGVERAYSSSVERLPGDSQRALVVLAVSSSGDLDVVARALARLDLDLAALEPAEDRGLLRVDDGRYEFRHPLVRSAIVQTAPPSVRRLAHRALADTLGEGEYERRAWHLAAAALGPDEEAASALAAAASRARDRSGYAAASEAFERAARLTPGDDLRLERLAEASEAAWTAGAAAQAKALADEADQPGADPRLRSRLLELRGRFEFQARTQARARELFLEAAALVEERDRAEAVRMLDLAILSCLHEGRITEALEVARRARALAPRDAGATDLHADYLLGRCLVLAGRVREGTALLERFARDVLAGEDISRKQIAGAALALTLTERGSDALAVQERAVGLARKEGPMTVLYALGDSADISVRHGEWQGALRAATEGLALARELGQTNIAADFLMSVARVEGLRGNAAACRGAAEEALSMAQAAGMALHAEQTRCAVGLLELGLDLLEDAVVTLEEAALNVAGMRICSRDVLPNPDLVEALVRLGRNEQARRALKSWLGRGVHGESPAATALAGRCRGLLAGDDFEAHFLDALEAHRAVADPFSEARTRLCYGERLRRAGRRVDSRSQLRLALETFERLEAEPWLRRARRELRATGEKLGRRPAVRGEELTPQELQIALQVAEGKTNRDVGAALFLSPKTVEFHLARVYRKLDISSRRELIRRFAAETPPTLATTAAS